MRGACAVLEQLAGQRIESRRGSFTGEDLKVLAKARPGVQIYTFEPAPSFYRVLVKNLANYANVQAKNVGLGPEKTSVCFFLRGSATWMEPMEQGKTDCRAGAGPRAWAPMNNLPRSH
eukprot:COSAG05_NODE_163_length_15471_cov_29.575072_10_plen_118_part_00